MVFDLYQWYYFSMNKNRLIISILIIVIGLGFLYYKEKNKKPSLVKDINRGSIFKKPLVVMINETSASASELFSNIVKNEKRTIIKERRITK